MSLPWPWTSEAPLRFDAFMAACLHDPLHGYYARKIRHIGSRGDFTTTPMLSPVLGRAIASWATRALIATRTRHLIELGPGEGSLAATVISHLPLWLRPLVRFHLVETSAPLRTIQEKKLGHRIHHHDSITSALAACQGRACIYSNEFIDAFPTRRFRRETSGFSESFLLPGKPPTELWLPTSTPPSSTWFSETTPIGQHFEVLESFHSWCAHLSSWRSGRMLTIDYGYPAPPDLHRRPLGTLRAYFHHQCFEGPEILLRPGHQDLTADVNFADLDLFLHPFARPLQRTTQGKWLQPFATTEDAFLLDPQGAGSAFLIAEHQALNPRHPRPSSPQ